jgi:ketosteroid isomerase-like protein
MRKVNLIVLALVAICLLAAPLVLGQGTKGGTAKGGNVEQQIAVLANQFTQAYLKADTGFMEKYFADELTAIHSDGKLSTKAQEISNIKSGTLKWESVDVHERKIRVYGNTAVVVALSSSKGTLGGKPYSGDYRTSQFWVKQKGDWQLVLLQITRVVPASQ